MGVQIVDRGMDPRKELQYKDAYKKEALLRLKWFRKNEERLVTYAEKPLERTVPAEVLEKMVGDRQSRYQNVDRKPRIHVDDAPPPLIDPNAVFSIMKPVDPETRQLIYKGFQKDGRHNYLTARMKITPENKYYFPETTSFGYGWQMFYSSSIATPVRLGRWAVVQQSFYRRNGVARDPDWYQEPSILSPTVCNCS